MARVARNYWVADNSTLLKVLLQIRLRDYGSRKIILG
jgi:hypothetical protein